MQKVDTYLQSLANICKKVESAYGMRDELNLANRDIKEVVAEINRRVTTEGVESIDSRNLAASKSLVLLSYISIRLKYYNKKRLDFSKYPGMRSAARVLINFTKQRTVNMQTMRSLNKLIVLSKSDCVIASPPASASSAAASAYCRYMTANQKSGPWV